jgi:hypothetical protein
MEENSGVLWRCYTKCSKYFRRHFPIMGLKGNIGYAVVQRLKTRLKTLCETFFYIEGAAHHVFVVAGL